MRTQPSDELQNAKNISGTDTPVIAFVADDHYAMPLAAAISSVIANLGCNQRLSVFIVDNGVSRTSKKKLSLLGDSKRASIQWLRLSEAHADILKGLPCGYVARSAYCKLLIPELAGPGYDRIVYLDSDVIVEGDISELWTLGIEKNYVLAVQDLINPFVSSPFGLRNWKQLGRRIDDVLFNTGVVVLNAARWREENVTHRLLQYLQDHHQHVQLCDQDAMNAVFQGEWGRLDPRWNVLPYMSIAEKYSLLSRKKHEELLAQAFILHFCGPSKPWNVLCRHPLKGRFFHYLDATSWAGWRPRWWTIDQDAIAYYARRIKIASRRMLHSGCGTKTGGDQ
jgi:lipopolysaccharide biosynthesis glycosyltransferase